MKTVTINTDKITDWGSFHDEFSEVMGFPSFYGRNMNAWIDCMSDIASPQTGMTRVHVKNDETLIIALSNGRDLKERLPNVFRELLECAAFVNYRKLNFEQKPMIAIGSDS